MKHQVFFQIWKNEICLIHEPRKIVWFHVHKETRFDAELCIDVMQVRVLFLILMDLCRRTVGLAHPLPVSQVGSNNIQVRLHYIDGNYTVLPEVVEASLGPHMQVTVHFNLLKDLLIIKKLKSGWLSLFIDDSAKE